MTGIFTPKAVLRGCAAGLLAPDPPVIRIASSNQVQRQQRRDKPVRENTHLVLDTLASRLRSYHSIVRVESLVFRVIRTQLIYVHPKYCLYEWMKLLVKGERVPGKSP